MANLNKIKYEATMIQGMTQIMSRHMGVFLQDIEEQQKRSDGTITTACSIREDLKAELDNYYEFEKELIEVLEKRFENMYNALNE